MQNQNDHLGRELKSAANANAIENHDQESFSVSLQPPSSPFATSEIAQKKEVETQENEVNTPAEHFIESAPDLTPTFAIQAKMNPEGDEEASLEPPSLDLIFAGAAPTPPDPSDENNDGEDQSDTTTNALPIQKKDSTGPFPAINSSSEATNQDAESNDILQQMGTSFGQDFSNVNIHQESTQASEIGAKAFAQGNDVHFASGEYQPSTLTGKTLIGHELTHVVQQRQGRVRPTIQRKGFQINDDTSLEKEADEMGAKAARGEELQPFSLNNRTSSSNSNTNIPQLKHAEEIIQRDITGSTDNQAESESVIDGGSTETPENAVSAIIENIFLCKSSDRNDSEEQASSPSRTQRMHNAVRDLRVNHENIETIKQAFPRWRNQAGESPGMSLQGFISRNFMDDYRVKATALLFEPSYDTPWTQIALCLIPIQTREPQFFDIMSNLSNPQKGTLRENYNRIFGHLGEGRLDLDIFSDFSGEMETRAWLISHRRLTDADNIYLATVASSISDGDFVVSTLRRLWGYGVSSFGRKLSEWDPSGNLPDIMASNPEYARAHLSGQGEEFYVNFARIGSKARSLIFTVMVNLNGDSFDNARQIFIEYVNLFATSRAERTETRGTDFTIDEQSRIRIARARLEAGEDMISSQSEMDAAGRELVEVYEERLQRLNQDSASVEDITYASNELTALRNRLTSEHDISAVTIQQRSLANDLYNLRSDRSAYAEKILEIYKANNLSNLIRESGLTDGERPPFDIKGRLRLSNVFESRMSNLIDASSDMPLAGAKYLRTILRMDAVDAQMIRNITDFLVSGSWDDILKPSVISTFNSRFGYRRNQSLSENQRLVHYLSTRGLDGESTWPQLREALAPAHTDRERLARAEIDIEQISSPLVAISDSISGDDTTDAAATSNRNLQMFAERANADAEEMQIFRQFYGQEVDLSARTWEEFERRITDMREARNAAAEGAATIVSTILAAALTPFIGPFAAAIISQVSSIITNGVLNDENEMLSADNAEALLLAAASGGFTRFSAAGSTFRNAIESLTQRPILRALMMRSAQETWNTSAQVVCDGLRGELTSENLMQYAQRSTGNIVAAGVMSHPQFANLKGTILRDALRTASTTMISQGFQVVEQTVMDGSNRDIADNLANKVLQGVGKSLLRSIGTASGGALDRHLRPGMRSIAAADDMEISDDEIEAARDPYANSEEPEQ